MGNKLYGYWAFTELATAMLLLKGIEGWAEISIFVVSHGLSMLLTYLIFIALIGVDRVLRKKIITRGFICFLLAVSMVPLVGPAVSLFFTLFLRFFPVHPVRTESFKKINRDVLMVLQKRFESRSIPITEALLVRSMTREDALKMVAIVGEMNWKPIKSNILKYIIRLSPFQNVVLMAIDMLRKQMDTILAEISALEARQNPDHAIFNRLANLYHEIEYLDLCEPIMKPFYQEKACEYALRAFNQGGENEDDALLSVRYLLEMDRVQKARETYDRVRSKGDYFFPKWITYEFEFSARQQDTEAFNDLYLLIASAGGVFVPAKVKEAATAWKKVLTSAWL
jgi:hypothetical protein